jgi:hypothetical protein
MMFSLFIPYGLAKIEFLEKKHLKIMRQMRKRIACNGSFHVSKKIVMKPINITI